MGLFSSAATADGYARARPPIHAWVVERLAERLRLAGRVRRALDLGCGAGLSTAPLGQLAGTCLGIEPVAAMLRLAPAVAPLADFAVARAEALPVLSASIDLVTAAGSLNYVSDLDASLREVRRVLAPGGALAVYDFGQGRTCREAPALGRWFGEFEHRYPLPPDSARHLDPLALSTLATGFRLQDSLEFERGVAFSAGRYLDYLMSEANVPMAVERGIREEEIRAWCARTLRPVFASGTREVVFRGYLACLVADAGEAGRALESTAGWE
ncbi:MAG TPA: class I SAM-dependent methyltransferase [Vicinamibacteria bacterium]|nr:class I SAM-dependent methyltransferase [Vicinamibacteria bacterium]